MLNCIINNDLISTVFITLTEEIISATQLVDNFIAMNLCEQYKHFGL